MPYQTKATAIINESIRSAVFIDEKALEPYANKTEPEISEETLSLGLFNNFKSKNISLAIHKFNKADISNIETKNYLFKDRDLILLDWKLDGESGEEFSLNLLADLVERLHIHFCCIYTSEKDIDNVFHNILSYFSNETEETYNDIKLSLAEAEDEILGILSDLKTISAERQEKTVGPKIAELMKSKKDLIKTIKEATGISDLKCAIIKTAIAFDKTQKSKIARPCPDSISFNKKVLVIKNTIVTILNKGENDPKDLISKLSNQIIESKNSFTQLLGLEMQNVFSNKGAFIDSTLLAVSKETLLYHRKQLLEEEGDDLPFKELIKEVLLEHAKLNVRAEDLSLLEDGFLDTLSGANIAIPHNDEMIKMNIFYNSSNLKDDKSVNFGDVFKDENNNYFICITALCDCLRPEKMKNSFYFAKGEKLTDKGAALKIGDTGFISYLTNNDIVRWSDVESGVDSDLRKYKPIYIKPELYNIPRYKFDAEGKVKINQLNEKGEVVTTTVSYISTIKPNYAQRIANHAFGYPIRVGIDFIKKK